MDVFAHALWTTAGGIVAQRRFQRRIRLGWLAVWGVLPDLVTFAVPAAIRVWRLLTGASKSLLPDGRGPHFDWVWGLYNGTHSAVVFAACFGAVWLVAGRPVLEMLGWGLHILIDVFTHSGFFAVQFLWPLSAIHLDGVRWEEPWFLAMNYAALAAVYLLLWVRRASDARLRH